MFEIVAHGASDVGLVRTHNEDSWSIAQELQLFLLADGLGGHQSGEIASREAIENFQNVFSELHLQDKVSSDELTRGIQQCVCQTNQYLFRLSLSHEQLKGMGTTLCSLSFHKDTVVMAHIGDSRIYRARSGLLEQMTVDHSWIKEHSIGENSRKGFLTKALGTTMHVEPSIRIENSMAGDLFLLCSDGLTDMIPFFEIERIVIDCASGEGSYKTLGECVRHLISMAKAYGGGDNITVILVEVVEVA